MNRPFGVLLAVSIILYLAVISFLQLNNPCLFGVDGYYHIKFPYLMRDYNIGHEFIWTQFSTFKNLFSDKEYLFHVIITSFTFLGNDIHTQARLSVIFFALLFILAFVFVQKRYVLKPLLILSIFALLLTPYFLSYINALRPKTTAISLILLLVYFLSEKRWLAVFIICMLYPLIHISFPFAIILVILIECARYFYNKEFYPKNVIWALLGLITGVIVHPHFPMNLFSTALNAVIVPWNTIFGNLSLSYGVEWNPADTKSVIINFFILFAGIFFLIILLFRRHITIGFHTTAFFIASAFFFLFSMFGNCYWYYTYPAGLVFLTMFFSDFLRDKSRRVRTVFIITLGLLLVSKAYLINRHNILEEISLMFYERNTHYETMAKWMNKNIPVGETIFHTSWSDSPLFLCFNPKNNYLCILDPIYMYAYNPEIYNTYENLIHGACDEPYKALQETFSLKYGYTGKGYGLYEQIKADNEHFEILFEDTDGAVFKII